MINETAMCKAMLSAAGAGGYKLLVEDDEVILEGKGWVFVGYIGTMPRKVLGLIVEHLGYIPDNQCFSVIKLKDGFEVASFERELLHQDVARETMGAKRTVKNTGVTMWSKVIYVCSDGELRGISPELLGIVDKGDFKASERGTFCLTNDMGTLWLSTVGAKYYEDDEGVFSVWQALKEVDWWRTGRTAAAGESGEQMKL